jgi:hypothetical protein
MEEAPSRSFFGIIFTSILLTLLLFTCSKVGDYYTVVQNWAEYRCQVEIMLLASLFGHDTMENLQFCLKAGFDNRASTAVAPFYGILNSFTTTLMTLLSSINSIRMVFATLVGSISQVFSEFTSRIESLMYRIQYSALRMKFLMSRIFGTIYSLMYMGMSGIKASQNAMNTLPFKFLTFMSCFSPETLVSVEQKGAIEIKDVQIGDVFEGTTTRVTGLVKMLGDGQEMIDIDGCHVSGNHYIKEGVWKYARNSAVGTKIAPWEGTVERPLISLNTSTHTLPIGAHLFSDYHETEEADSYTMSRILGRLNCRNQPEPTNHTNYITGVDPSTEILLDDGTYCPAHSITLGTKTRHGTIVGIIIRECSTFSIHNGERFGYATAVWKDGWKRGEIDDTTPGVCINFAIEITAMLETRGGIVFRDMFEIHHMDVEEAYKNIMEGRV